MKVLNSIYLKSLLKDHKYKNIVKLAINDDDIVIELTNLLEESSSDLQDAVVETFGWLGGQRGQFSYSLEEIALPHIETLMQNSNAQIRVVALKALEGLSMDWEWKEFKTSILKFTPLVFNLINDEDLDVRKTALEKLYLISNWWKNNREGVRESIESTSPIIIKSLKDCRMKEESMWAARTVAELAPDIIVSEIKIILDFLDDSSFPVLLATLATLRYLTQAYPKELENEVLPPLINLLESDESRVQTLAAKVAFPILNNQLYYENEITQLDTIRALSKIREIEESIIKPAIPQLRELQGDQNEIIQELVSKILRN